MAGLNELYEFWKELYPERKILKGTKRDDTLTYEGDFNFYLKGNRGNDDITGGNNSDFINAGSHKDTIEAGRGNDIIFAGNGSDTVLSFSWGGEPDIAQDTDAEKVEANEPLQDNDHIYLGGGQDTLVFRWLLDAKKEILDKHRDAETNDVDYRAVAGENDAPHDHWVETIGDDIVWDYHEFGDTLVFEGHTVTLDRIDIIDADGDGATDDSVAFFYSEQGGQGAHQGDELGSVTFIDYLITESEIDINKGVFYGVEDPYSIDG